MLVSWNWLKDYVRLEMSPDELAQRLAMSGLNHEGTEPVGDDLAIDLEVTSNRPDCLGHIGVAREVAVLWEQPLTIPDVDLKTGATKVEDLTKVSIECPQLCYRYTARVIRGVKIGPSPQWLAKRLQTLGVAVINNVVDVTNYVLMECGQPLHAFDFAELGGPEIIVRDALPGEEFEAIDHRTYSLESGMCVIADKHGAVALGGVMGGADTEVSSKTTDLLIEAAQFAPVSIRGTARQLNLHSPSSFRFERGIDPEQVDWASRRCCELILNLAGGELAEGVIDVGSDLPDRPKIVLRLPQLERILGIDIDGAEVRRILQALGCSEQQADATSIEVTAPSWRRDLTREIDLVEEVARIHGYEKIPEDVGVPMAASHRSDSDRVLARVRSVLTAAGFDECMSASVVSREWSAAVSPWSAAEPIVANTPLLRGADCLRRSLIPSVLDARRINESLGNDEIEIFETAKVYLPQAKGLPEEPLMLSMSSGGDFFYLKGVIEGLLSALQIHVDLAAAAAELPLLSADKTCELQLEGERLGWLGEVSQQGLKQFNLRSPATVAELKLPVFERFANLVPQYVAQSVYPPISQDLNFVVDESLRWSQLAATVQSAAGKLLQQIEYQETYRDPQADGPDKKRLLLSIELRSSEGTLTGEQADEVRTRIVEACSRQHSAKLLA